MLSSIVNALYVKGIIFRLTPVFGILCPISWSYVKFIKPGMPGLFLLYLFGVAWFVWFGGFSGKGLCGWNIN